MPGLASTMRMRRVKSQGQSPTERAPSYASKSSTPPRCAASSKCWLSAPPAPAMDSPLPPHPPGYQWFPPGLRGPTRCCAGRSAARWSSSPAPRVRPPRSPAGARTTAGTARGPCSPPSAPRCGQGHSGRGWRGGEQAVLRPTITPPNRLGAQETLIYPCGPLPHGHGAIPTAVPRMPDMHRLARGHWLTRGHNTPCPPASLSLTLGLQKKDLRETCHAPHPPEAESPPFSALEANSLQEVRDAPSPRPPSRGPCHHRERGRQGRKSGPRPEVRKHPLSLLSSCLWAETVSCLHGPPLRSRSPAVSQFYLAGFDPRAPNPSVRDPAPRIFAAQPHFSLPSNVHNVSFKTGEMMAGEGAHSFVGHRYGLLEPAPRSCPRRCEMVPGQGRSGRFWGRRSAGILCEVLRRLFPSSFFLQRREASRLPWGGLALSRGPREASGSGGGGGEVFLGVTLGVAGTGVVVALRMICGEVLCV